MDPVSNQQRPTEIRFDIPCINCSYNLRGLASERSCPECGNPICESLRGDLLRFSDPRLIRRLQLGVALKLCQILFTFLGIAFISILLDVMASSLQHVLAVLFIVGCCGTFLFTTPKRSEEAGRGALRLFVRWTMAVGLMVLLPSLAVLEFLNVTAMDGVFGVLLTIVGSGLYVAMFVEIAYLGRLATLIPNRKISRAFNWVAITVPALILFAVIVESVMTGQVRRGITIFAISWDFSWTSIYFSLMSCALSLTAAWYVLLLFRLCMAMKSEMRVSQARISQERADAILAL